MPFDLLRRLGRDPAPGAMNRRQVIAWGIVATLVGWGLSVFLALLLM